MTFLNFKNCMTFFLIIFNLLINNKFIFIYYNTNNSLRNHFFYNLHKEMGGDFIYNQIFLPKLYSDVGDKVKADQFLNYILRNPNKKWHTFHIVSPSPWPFFLSLTLLSFILHFVSLLYRDYTALDGFYASFGLLLILITVWFRDIIRESTFMGYHTLEVQLMHRTGFVLFLISEVMIFFGFFWAHFYFALTPSIFGGNIWPPEGIVFFFLSENIYNDSRFLYLLGYDDFLNNHYDGLLNFVQKDFSEYHTPVFSKVFINKLYFHHYTHYNRTVIPALRRYLIFNLNLKSFLTNCNRNLNGFFDYAFVNSHRKSNLIKLSKLSKLPTLSNMYLIYSAYFLIKPTTFTSWSIHKLNFELFKKLLVQSTSFITTVSSSPDKSFSSKVGSKVFYLWYTPGKFDPKLFKIPNIINNNIKIDITINFFRLNFVKNDRLRFNDNSKIYNWLITIFKNNWHTTTFNVSKFKSMSKIDNYNRFWLDYYKKSYFNIFKKVNGSTFKICYRPVTPVLLKNFCDSFNLSRQHFNSYNSHSRSSYTNFFKYKSIVSRDFNCVKILENTELYKFFFNNKTFLDWSSHFKKYTIVKFKKSFALNFTCLFNVADKNVKLNLIFESIYMYVYSFFFFDKLNIITFSFFDWYNDVMVNNKLHDLRSSKLKKLNFIKPLVKNNYLFNFYSFNIKNTDPFENSRNFVFYLNLRDSGALINPFRIPLLNTVVLLTSGCTLMWGHVCLRMREFLYSIIGVAITICFAFYFIACQAYEYVHASFSINDGAYGSTFYMLTGLHGFHVLVGTIFLIVCLGRLIRKHFTDTSHLGFEAAIWYWHFVDVVWLFLYLFVYVWPNMYYFSDSYIAACMYNNDYLYINIDKNFKDIKDRIPVFNYDENIQMNFRLKLLLLHNILQDYIFFFFEHFHFKIK